MSRPALVRFCLYVAGDAANSLQAIANLTALCQLHLPNRHAIEVVDVFREPQRALAESVFVTPTTIKSAPTPPRRIIGTLSHTPTVLHALGLGAVTA